MHKKYIGSAYKLLNIFYFSIKLSINILKYILQSLYIPFDSKGF